jgi:hypothetical protein
MRKFVMLFCLIVNGIAADGVEQSNGEVEETVDAYEWYRKLLHKDYAQSLVKALSDDEKAIVNLYTKTENELTAAESKAKTLQCDGSHGWCGAPSANSETGKKYAAFEQEHKAKSAINMELREAFVKHKDEVEKEIIQKAITELIHRCNTMERDHIVLGECPLSDKECLARAHVSWDDIIKPHYLINYYDGAYDDAVKLVEEKKIPLTREQVVAIAQKSKKTIEEGNKLTINQLDTALRSEIEKVRIRIRALCEHGSIAFEDEIRRKEEEFKVAYNDRQD